MSVYLQDTDVTVHCGDVLDVLPVLPEVDCVVTSPPYVDARPEYPGFHDWPSFFWLLCGVTAGPVLINVGRIFRDGTEQQWWLPMIDAAKRVGFPHRDTLVWVKPNANPIRGRVFADSHEYVLCFGDGFQVDEVRRPHAASTVARFGRAWTNHRGVKQPRESRVRRLRSEPNPAGALPRSYVELFVGREKGNPHPAPMPLELAEHLVKLGCPPGGTVLDPFAGSGTTLLAARRLNRNAIGVELSREYCGLASRRLAQQSLLAEPA